MIQVILECISKVEIMAFLIKNPDERELAQALRAAIAMSKEERTEMRRRTRKTAEIAFDYREYKNTIKGLFGID